MEQTHCLHTCVFGPVGQGLQQWPVARVWVAQYPENLVTLVQLEGVARLFALLTLWHTGFSQHQHLTGMHAGLKRNRVYSGCWRSCDRHGLNQHQQQGFKGMPAELGEQGLLQSTQCSGIATAHGTGQFCALTLILHLINMAAISLKP